MYTTVRTLFKTSINGNLCRCLNRTLAVSSPTADISTNVRNYSSYRSSQQYNPEEKIEYEVSKNPEEWKFVSRLMPYKYIPEPEKKDEYPSGWTMPNTSDLEKLPYYLRRSKNHMIPVYLHISHRGMRKITVIRHVKGDIWLFEKDLKAFVEDKSKKLIGTKIDEVAEKVLIRGDYVHHVLEWVQAKGF